MRCTTCGELLELREVPASEGRDGDLRVELYGLRLRCCGTPGHPPEPPAPHFVADLVAAVTAGEAVPQVRRRGLFGRFGRGRAACFRCGNDLGSVPVAAAEVRARVRIPGGAPVTLTVTGPARACEGCRLLQVEDRVSLEGALLGALRAGGLALPE